MVLGLTVDSFMLEAATAFSNLFLGFMAQKLSKSDG